MAGMPRKPALIRRMEGNPGRRPIPEEITTLGEVLLPAGLSVEAQDCWHVIKGSLPIGLLSQADTAVMERMANAWARYRECQRFIERAGLMVRGAMGEMRRNPYLLVQRQAAEEMHQCGEVLGLSPVARTRIAANLVPPEPDPMELLLDGAGNGMYVPAEAAE